MSLIKLGESIRIQPSDIRDTDSVLSELDTEIINEFTKTAAGLKEIAPKANDFLYFTAIMMHAAESALLDESGVFKTDSSGNDLTAIWEKSGKDSLKWVCSDKNVLPYRNSNHDIFPESELKTAYKKWVGKPLCLDHQSQSVDHIRGVIVDTYYDEKHKRIIALCALDKVNYPDLARKVSTGYATCVSMGTAVGKAICTENGCHKVARLEPDFCEHMRARSCYGEINTELSPIELSIVVNGADPKAKIRHIVAAADSIAKYVEDKKELLNATKDAVSLSEIKDIESNLSYAQEALSRLKVLAEKEEPEEDKNEVEDIKPPYGQHGVLEQEETVLENTNRTYNFPERFASLLNDLETRVDKIINKVASLEANNKNNEDFNMSKELDKKAYFQGAGGVNEPTPGKPKYEKEDSDKIRNTLDKQMTPTPTSLGGADGLAPGDLEKKKALKRATDEAVERKLRREAAVEAAKKVAYFQGGGGVAEPTPGKPKYEKEDSDKIRNTLDKQMVGASPFPGVGSVDGLYGDDLKKKQMLSRAKLTGKFIKAANVDGSANLGNSRWDIFADNRLILTATVKDIAGNRAETLFTSIATKDFGGKIIATIKSEGFDKAVSLYKGAQIIDPSALPAAPADMAPALEAAPLDEAVEETVEETVEDSGFSGEPLDQVRNLVSNLDNNVADLKKSLEALEEENVDDLGALVSESPVTASSSLPVMRKKLNGALIKGIKQAIAELEDNKEELELLAHIYSTPGNITKQNKVVVREIHTSAVTDTRTATANVHKLMSAFVKYARGTEALVKRAQAVDFGSGTVSDTDTKDLDKLVAEWEKTDFPDANEAFEKIEDVLKAEDEDEATHTGHIEHDTVVINPDVSTKTPEEVKKMLEGLLPPEADTLSANDVTVDLATKQLTTDKQTAKDLFASANARSELRAKLAQKGVTFSDMLKAHPAATRTQLDVKPSKDGDKVETLEEVHSVMRDVALAPPRNVRTAAEGIQKMVVAGRIDPKTDFPGLISEGLDPAAVKYWKSFWGEAKDGGSEFASELVKEYAKKKAAEEIEAYKVKIARAYELSYEMAEKGFIPSSREAVKEQVESVLAFNDEAFESLKKVVARQASSSLRKTAMPLVGADSFGFGKEVPALPATRSDAGEFQADLNSMFDSKPRR